MSQMNSELSVVGRAYLTSSSGLAVQAQDLKAPIYFNLEIGERDLLLLWSLCAEESEK